MDRSQNTKLKIAVLVSGGVDSSLALALLKEHGYDVTAFYLKIWLEDELSYLGDCPWEEDLSFVRKVCDQLKVPLEVIPMQKEYWSEIVKYVTEEVSKGRTPNPDVMCNNRIKFGLFLTKISSDYTKVASGHYAQACTKRSEVLINNNVRLGGQHLKNETEELMLKKSPDPIKDQTYFLAYLRQEQIQKILFPIGHLEKKEVRSLAKKYNLANQDRKDSQGICFLGKFKYNDFLKFHLGEKPGDILEFETGKKLGEHEGFWYYTLGQRKGIKLSGGPWFVVKKDTLKNQIFVSNTYHDEEKKRDTFEIAECNWISGEKSEKTKLQVKLRHGENSYPCDITWITPDHAQVKIDGTDQGIAPGQFAVFYDGEYCLGAGVIQR